LIKRWIAAVAAGLTLTGCFLVNSNEAYVDFEPSWKATGTRPDALLTASIQQRPDTLAIRYTLRNNGSEPVVAYVGVTGEAASHAWDVYVTAREDGVVEIAKRTFDIPPNVNADSIGQIEGVVLAPGAEFAEDFAVPLPLKARRPYTSKAKLPDPVRKVAFCLGVLLQKEAPQPQPAADSTRGRYPLNGPQHLFCSEVVNLT
jgi:hypothetical protein